MDEITILGTIGFGILAVVIFTSGYVTGKKEMRAFYITVHKELFKEAFSVGVKETASAIDNMMVKLQKREGIELPAYKITWSGVTITKIEEIKRKENSNADV